MKTRFVLTTALILSAVCSAARAQEEAKGGLEERMKKLEQRQEELEAENQRLKLKLGELDERPSVKNLEEPGAEEAPSILDRIGTIGPGQGAYFKVNEDLTLTLGGFIRARFQSFDGILNRNEENGGFNLAAARIDFGGNLFKDFDFFMEVDFAIPNAMSGQSDLGLILAQLNWKVMGDAVQLRFGKFTNPFSAENFRPFREFDTLERSTTLNSLFTLPAYDSQFGIMLLGRINLGDDESALEYYAVVDNGNGTAVDNLNDNNEDKQLTGRLVYKRGDTFELGAAVDYSDEENQILTIVDLGITPILQVPVRGRRYGAEVDFFFQTGGFSARGELIALRFKSPNQSEVDLQGGYLQVAQFISGDFNGGVQALLRGEVTEVNADPNNQGNTLSSAVFGLNWFLNANVRARTNFLLTNFDGPSNVQGFSRNRTYPMLFADIQYQF